MWYIPGKFSILLKIIHNLVLVSSNSSVVFYSFFVFYEVPRLCAGSPQMYCNLSFIFLFLFSHKWCMKANLDFMHFLYSLHFMVHRAMWQRLIKVIIVIHLSTLNCLYHLLIFETFRDFQGLIYTALFNVKICFLLAIYFLCFWLASYYFVPFIDNIAMCLLTTLKLALNLCKNVCFWSVVAIYHTENCAATFNLLATFSFWGGGICWLRINTGGSCKFTSWLSRKKSIPFKKCNEYDLGKGFLNALLWIVSHIL